MQGGGIKIFNLIVCADTAHLPNFAIYKYNAVRRKTETRYAMRRWEKLFSPFRRTNDCADLSVELTNTSLSVFLEPLWTDDALGRVAMTFVHILLVGKLTDERRRPRRHGYRVQSFLSESCTAAHVWQSVNWPLLHKVVELSCLFKNFYIFPKRLLYWKIKLYIILRIVESNMIIN